MAQPHIRATISLLPTEASGRTSPLVPLCRPLIHLEGDPVRWSIHIVSLSPSPLYPGQEGEITASVLSWHELESRLPVGTRFEICEGYRCFGYGEVTAIESSQAVASGAKK